MDPFSHRALVGLAEAQHGVVTHAQLLAFGLSAEAIKSRLRRGALRRLHRSVYALGHAALRDEGRWLAAVLACGEGAVLSHLSAARLWRLTAVPFDAAAHVTVPRRVRRHRGIVAHRSPLAPADVTRVRGVPVTVRARTVVDLADLMTYAALRTTVDGGVRLDVGAVREAAARAPNRRGRGVLAHLLGDDGAELRTRSALERRLRRLVRDAGLPAPRVNARILGRERDVAWPDHRLVVEVDGHAFHAARGAREADHERDAELVLAGWRVLRVTYAQLADDPAAVVARLRVALQRRRGA